MATIAVFMQPSGSIIRIRCGDHWAERMLNGGVQQGWYGQEERVITRLVQEWQAFEDRIGSIREAKP